MKRKKKALGFRLLLSVCVSWSHTGQTNSTDASKPVFMNTHVHCSKNIKTAVQEPVQDVASLIIKDQELGKYDALSEYRVHSSVAHSISIM